MFSSTKKAQGLHALVATDDGYNVEFYLTCPSCGKIDYTKLYHGYCKSGLKYQGNYNCSFCCNDFDVYLSRI